MNEANSPDFRGIWFSFLADARATGSLEADAQGMYAETLRMVALGLVGAVESRHYPKALVVARSVILGQETVTAISESAGVLTRRSDFRDGYEALVSAAGTQAERFETGKAEATKDQRLEAIFPVALTFEPPERVQGHILGYIAEMLDPQPKS